MAIRIAPANIQRHFEKLATIGNQPDGSFSRIAFSDEESAAMAYIRHEGETFGLQGHYDAIGNLFLRTPGDFERWLLVGSHLDTVPYGGNYDGAAGVVAGLEAIRAVVEAGGPTRTGLELVAWRGEEYTFNAVYKGSATAIGISDPHILYNQYGAQTLRDAIREQGFDPTYIDEGKPTVSQAYLDKLEGYLELHIEQGVLLERRALDVGIVTSIAGDRRFLVVLKGRFDHSGATPMGIEFRRDVNLAMAYMHVRLDELGARHRQKGTEFVQTVGIINADPEIDKKYPDVHSNSVTKVSGLAYFTLDIMSPDDAFMDAYAKEVGELLQQVAGDFGVDCTIEQTDWARGLPNLSPPLQEKLQRAAERASHPHCRLPSGAGHDAAMVAEARRSDGSSVPVGMLFVPCVDGVSHSKDEYAKPEWVTAGAEVLAEAFAEDNL